MPLALELWPGQLVNPSTGEKEARTHYADQERPRRACAAGKVDSKA